MRGNVGHENKPKLRIAQKNRSLVATLNLPPKHHSEKQGLDERIENQFSLSRSVPHFSTRFTNEGERNAMGESISNYINNCRP
jgi:hypothetical protein